MITEDYVSFAVSKLLKEKGFSNDFCQKWYNIDETEPFPCPVGFKGCLPAPTLQMAMKWLREVHNLALNVTYALGMWNYSIYRLDAGSSGIFSEDFDTYEEASEAGIKYCLENLI